MPDSTVMWLTFRQLFVRRRLFAAAAFALIPLVVTLVHRLANPEDPERAEFVAMLCTELSVGTILPLAAVVFGTIAFGGEIDEGTVVYLLVKPLARWRVVLAKYAVAVIATLAVMVPGVVLPWLAIGPQGVPQGLPMAFIAAGTMGALLYGGLFLFLGIVTRRSLVFGLGYVIGIEFVLSRTFGGLRSFSIREYVSTIAGTMTELPLDVADVPVSTATVWTMGAIILVGSLAASIVSLRRFELAERL